MTDTAPSLPVPLTIDYTSRDYTALREDLIARVRQRVPEWTGTDPADFGVALVEAMAHLGDMLGYYVDRVASESFIATAMRRSSIIQHARALGYRPAGYRAAEVVVVVTNATASPVVLPKGARVRAVVSSDTGSLTQMFETTAAVTIGGTSSSEVVFRHGETIYDEVIGVSTATPSMEWRLMDAPVVDASTRVRIGSTVWSEVLHLPDSGPNDPVYAVEDDGSGNVTILFGDGVSGAIPALHQTITATYVIGGGIAGNIPAGAVRDLISAPGLSEAEVLTLNLALSFANAQPAVGGTDPEVDDQIRWAAPQVARAANRAVTVADHAALALAVPGVGAAHAAASGPYNVAVYIAPYRTPGSAETYPGGVHADTPEMTALKAAVTAYLADRVLLGTTVQVVEPEYADVPITIEVVAKPTHLQSEVEQNVLEAFLQTFNYVYMSFAQTIYREQIESILNQVEGVMVARVTDLRHEHGADPEWPTPDGVTLPSIDDVIWIFKESKVTLTVTGGIVL